MNFKLKFTNLIVVLIILLSGFLFFSQREKADAVTCGFGSQVGSTKMCRGYITSTSATTWTVPWDWNNASNTIEVIGGGGSGLNGWGGTGGGGGGYSKVTNITLSGNVTIKVGAGGTPDSSGADTYLCNSLSNCDSISASAVQVGAKGGSSGQGGGTGGQASSGVGTVKYSGGNGGAAWAHGSGEGGSGGGGAAGPFGNGANGGSNSSADRTDYGGGGGGNGGGYVGHSDEVEADHYGGNNYLNTGGGVPASYASCNGSNGTSGGGGSGGSVAGCAYSGGTGPEWDTTHGSGGGGGGGSENTSNNAGSGGLYGGGGGGKGAEGGQTSGSGAQGIIVITYTPAATAPNIRQEINIIDGEVTASGDHSALVRLNSSKYSNATYYFEVVAKVTSGTLTVALERQGTATQDATVSVTGTSYTRLRSSAFTPPAGSTNYQINLSGGTGPSVIAARIIVIQESINKTASQIEIGNQETGKTNTTSSALSNPKYWKYDSANWDGQVNFYAEVSFKTGTQLSSSTIYTTAGTYTYKTSPGVTYTVVEAWGAGGGGRNTASTQGGGGGGGGAYVRSTTTPVVGSSHTLVVPAGGAAGTAGAVADTTYDTTVVVADSGTGVSGNSGGAGGTVANSTGDVEYAGGAGKSALGTNDTGGGGGGSGGPSGAGEDAQAGQTNSGGYGGKANGGTGGEGNGSGSGTGGAGSSNVNGGGGGGGSFTTSQGGAGGDPGGGAGGGDTTGTNAAGGRGQIRLTEWYGEVGIALEEDNGSFGSWTFKKMIARGSASTASTTRVLFTPTTGRHYRIVASTTNASVSYDIYNAKIVVEQDDLSWSLASTTYASKSLTTTSQESIPGALFFSPSGTAAYVLGTFTATIYQYTLSTAWDVSTASYASKSFDVSGQDTGPKALVFSQDGYSAYIVGIQSANNDSIYQYSLTTPWDISTASYASKSLVVNAQETNPSGMAFSSDGTKAYVIGTSNDTVSQYTLTTAWDVSTGSYASKNLSVTAQDTSPTGIYFSSDGTKMYMVGDTNNSVFQYSLGTAWDISTGSYDSVSFSVASQDGVPGDLFLSPTGKIMYIVGDTNNAVFQYNIGDTTATKLETQYLLANTGSFGGTTGLKDYDTFFDTSEWDLFANTYYHEVNGVSSGTGDLKLQSDPNGTPADVSGSTVTDAIEVERSSSMSLLSSGTIDVNVTGTGTLNASRIIGIGSQSSAPVLSQAHYRFRSDQSGESGSNFLAAEDTAITSNVIPGDRLRLRFLVSNTGGSASNYTYKIEYAQTPCSSWTAVASFGQAASEHWVMDYSPFISNSSASSDISGLTNPGGMTFVSGYLMTSANQAPVVTLDANKFTELEYSIKALAGASVNSVYCFRLTNAGSSAYFTYTNQPQITLKNRATRNIHGGLDFGDIAGGILRIGGILFGGKGAGDEGVGSGNQQSGGGQGGGGGNTE